MEAAAAAAAEEAEEAEAAADQVQPKKRPCEERTEKMVDQRKALKRLCVEFSTHSNACFSVGAREAGPPSSVGVHKLGGSKVGGGCIDCTATRLPTISQRPVLTVVRHRRRSRELVTRLWSLATRIPQ